MERDGKQSFEKETKGFPTANGEVRLREVEVKVNGLDREVGVLKEQMTHLATDKSLHEFKEGTTEKFAEVKAEIAQVRAENREGIAEVKAEIAQVRAENRENHAELKAMIAQSEARMFKMLAMQTTIIVAALIGVLISPLL